MPMPLSMGATAQQLVSIPSTSHPRTAQSSPPTVASAAEQMRHGELCQSGQPPTPGRDALTLLALLALAGSPVAWDVARDPFTLRLDRSAGSRAPPGPFGTGLLAAVCVSRT